uniref:DNA-directed RNA polymerase II subunit RPB4 n=1 Tax=Lygus hesperus TaxID=30085 RepID=A0A0A9XS09_LYGHE
MIQNCREQLEILQEGCASEVVVHELRSRRLRLREENVNTVNNAHLATIMVDANGNVILPSNNGDNGNSENVRNTTINNNNIRGANDNTNESANRHKEKMKPFEVIALCSLTPHTAEEAIVLLPSLSRFETSDVQDILSIMEQ